MIDTQGNRFYDKYRGVVVDNNDPQSRGRVKGKVPQVLESTEVWAMPCVPFAGDGVGFYAVPDSGTGVWVEFEAGDPSYPIWAGCFWGEGQLPDQSNPDIKIWKTTKFIFRVDDALGEISIQSAEGGTTNSEIKLTSIDIQMSSNANITAEVKSGGGKKTDLSAVSFNVNNGGLEVL